MRDKLLVLVLLTPALMGIDLLRSRNDDVERGNAQMKAGKWEDALGAYDKAAAKLPAEPGVHLNRGTALYALSRWDEAAQAFLRATEAKAPALKASAFYNLGNAQFQGGKFGDAVESFKKSLAYDPTDQRAKWNLELALKKKREEDRKKQEQSKEGDKKDDKSQNDDKKNEDKKNDQQAKDDKKQDEQGKDKQGDQKPEQDKQAQQQGEKPEQQPGEKPEQQQQENKPEPTPPKQAQAGDKNEKQNAAPDMREIDAVLDSLEQSPKALEQERARLRAVRRAPPARDW